MKRIALVGNPNVGKSTLFNRLTRGRVHTGNWPGKTVECKDGVCTIGSEKVAIFDLPGAYSLSPFSEDEHIVAEAIGEQKFDAIIQVTDACNLERNLYFTLDLLQITGNVVVALNKCDAARKGGMVIDASALSKSFGVPFVPVSARTGEGVGRLIDSALEVSKGKARPPCSRDFFNGRADGIRDLVMDIADKHGVPACWLACKMVEGDEYAIGLALGTSQGAKAAQEAQKLRLELESGENDDIGSIISKRKFGIISAALGGPSRPPIKLHKQNYWADSIILNPLAGIPVFLVVLWLAFQLSFVVSEPFSGLIGMFFSWLGQSVAAAIAYAGLPGWIASLLQEGVIGGVGSVLMFAPAIAMLFFFMQILEDSGYMSRVAVLLDGIAKKAGLSGKAFLPLILGFGCSVPAIMSTRVLEREKDRVALSLAIPFMSCSARLPIYVLFAGVFFPQHQGLVILSLYVLGSLAAITTLLLLKWKVFKRSAGELLIELPEYQMPQLGVAASQAASRTLSFARKAGTIILAASVVLWFLGSMPYGVEYGSRESFAGMLGGFVSPIFAPLGFGTWQASISLIFGFAAKEIVVGSLATAYSAGEAGLGAAISSAFTPLSALSFMAFSLLYVPCIAAIAAIKKESGSWKIAAGAALYYLIVAWLVSFAIYQGGRIMGF